jgi:hypothetical protein
MLDDPFMRIHMRHTFRRMVERIEGEGNKKIIVGCRGTSITGQYTTGQAWR